MPPLPEVSGVRHSEHDLPTGVRLHVAEAGDPRAPAVLAVHGWPQHWWMWRHVIARLAPSHRVLCPDLRGLGWSGSPADGDFTKARLAEDMLALLDVLGIREAGYLGHDWGGWAGWLAAIRAPERITRLMVLSVPSPWLPRGAALKHAWRFAYQGPLAAPKLGPAIVRDGRFARAALGRSMDAATAAVYADVIEQPGPAAASSALYRQFLLREQPALAAGRYAGARVAMPVLVLSGRHDPVVRPELLGGLERHAAGAELELVDGGHFLPDECGELVAERAAAWFA
jgi:pimeloyl-ACP methyl ester carboxylesterase